MRVLLTIQYLGTRYGGWQAQSNAVSIQQTIEDALEQMFGTGLRLHGSGRTDAGVHAAAQRAHVDVPFGIPPRGLILGLNRLLPGDIRVTAAAEVPEDFHARFSVTSKTYDYRIWNDEVADVFAAETHAHVARPLDVDAMRQAAAPLVGTHDFKAFTVAAPEVESTVRTIYSMAVERGDRAIVMSVTADGFLRYMVRRIAGSLIEIGAGKLAIVCLERSLEPSFETARWTAPAKGLTLRGVTY